MIIIIIIIMISMIPGRPKLPPEVSPGYYPVGSHDSRNSDLYVYTYCICIIRLDNPDSHESQTRTDPKIFSNFFPIR